MKLAGLLFVIVPFVSALQGDDEDENHFHSLDMDREPAVFSAGVRKSGFTYLDSMKSEALTHMDLGAGMLLDMATTYIVENEVEVRDLAGGGKGIDVTIQRIKLEVEQSGTIEGMASDLVCDTRDTAHPSECSAMDLSSLVGQSHHFVVDDEGTIAEGPQDAAPLAQVGPNEQLQQASRMLQLIPFHPVAPGESWDAGADYGAMGHFTGTATLLGYKDFEGYDCAAIHVTGELHLDNQFLQDVATSMLGGAAGPTGLTISDAPMSVKILWDNEMNLARYSKTDMAYTMGMDNPVGGSKMKIPIHAVTVMHSQVEEEKQ